MENMYTKKWKHLNMSFSEVKNAKKKTKKNYSPTSQDDGRYQ